MKNIILFFLFQFFLLFCFSQSSNLENFDDKMTDSRIQGPDFNKEKRNSMNAWIPAHHWICGFIWHYVMKSFLKTILRDLESIFRLGYVG